MSEVPQVTKRRKTIDSYFKPREHNKTKEDAASKAVTSLPDEQPLNSLLFDIRRVEDRGTGTQPVEPLGNVEASFFQRDPGLRLQVWQHPVNKQDEVRRAYLNAGPYQPVLQEYPQTKSGKQLHRFQGSWFTRFPWLEYSPAKYVAFCLPCFVFESNPPKRSVFTVEGFRKWKRVNDGTKCAFLTHMGEHDSVHMKEVRACKDLGDTSHHIDKLINIQSKEDIEKNRLRLKMTIDCLRYLAYQTCAFRGHDESINSSNRGNFIELIKLLASVSDKIAKVVLENAQGNAKYTSPKIQKEILSILANKVRKKIREEVGNSKYCILVDEAQDESFKEQMAIVLRFVDDDGVIKDRFFDVLHVKNTTALTLKQAISDVLAHNHLHIDNMRGQGYDGASNMRGAFNGLQALFLKDCPTAYYVHCFAHRLQLALVGASKEVGEIWRFYSKLNAIVNFGCASPLRQDVLQSSRLDEISKMLAIGELETGKGGNQMSNLHRPGATRWSSHFGSVRSLITMFGATCAVLREIMETTTNIALRGESQGLYLAMTSFEFVFILQLMSIVMEITDMFCQALQQKSQDIVNVMNLVINTKTLLQKLREDGWVDFIKHVNSFCNKHDIVIPDMNSRYLVGTLRSAQQRDFITVSHHYRVDLFNAAIDFQLVELNTRFNENTMELLILSSALDPRGAYKSFNVDDICRLAEKYYPQDFSSQEIIILRCQLLHYEVDVTKHLEFQNMSTILELSKKLVETRKSEDYYLIHRLICLVLTLPVSTATTERAFSAMKLVKTKLRTKMEDDFLRDCMIIHIERELAKKIDSDSIIDDFCSLKDRRAQLK